MADWTVVSVGKGWAGNVRRNTVVVTGTNADDLSPALVGLHRIDAVVPTGRSGTISGVTAVAAGAADYDGTNLSLFSAAASPGAFSNSSAELYIYGV
jgi:hypothetical protein